MNSVKILFFLSMMVLWNVFIISPVAAESASEAPEELIAKGRDLFNEKGSLGAKYACMLCHKGEKAVKRSVVEKLNDEELAAVINQQLLKKAKASAPIAADGEQMQALIAYIRHEHVVSG